ncbi:MAG: hypothetical protein JXQ65_12175 [Candidatus Marinimicrobia bacterium]|nr:hypothetical protein [Candidatus Neomarinimicrobiota bacterium]
MKKFVKNLSKNETVIISSFSSDQLGFPHGDKEDYTEFTLSQIENNLLFFQIMNHDYEKHLIRNLIDAGFSTFYFIGKGLVSDVSLTAGLFIITDHVNMSGINPLRGTNDDHYGVRFPDMSGTYTTPKFTEKINNCYQALLFIPKNMDEFSNQEMEVIQKTDGLKIFSHEMYSGVITAKHAGCISHVLFLTGPQKIFHLFV